MIERTFFMDVILYMVPKDEAPARQDTGASLLI